MLIKDIYESMFILCTFITKYNVPKNKKKYYPLSDLDFWIK